MKSTGHAGGVNGAAVIAFVMNAGLLVMLAVPALVALYVKVFRRAGRAGRAGERAAEIDDVFNPARRRQVEQMEISDNLRVDAETGGGDPLEGFPDPDGVRDQLDPEGIYDARRTRSRRGGPDREDGPASAPGGGERRVTSVQLVSSDQHGQTVSEPGEPAVASTTPGARADGARTS